MARFLIRRIIFLIITLFVVSIAIFAISELAPGNIAINTLGNTITPQQEASFNAQNGLDQPVVTRYLRWVIGSDWQAARQVGQPITRVYDPANERYSWWAVAEDGTFYQNYTPDGETLIRVERQPDGSTTEVVTSDDIWQPNEAGLLVYWGVDKGGHAAMWVKGDDQVAYTLTQATWTSQAGAPRSYIPLQRGLLRGDPGMSFKDRRPVSEVLPRRFAATLLLASIVFIIVMPIALVLGLVAGLNEGLAIDRSFSVAGLIATATPEFASGVFLILIFVAWLGWFPGAVTAKGVSEILENPLQLVLPVLTLALIEVGYVLRITRASMVEVMRTNYIRAAILKGLPRRRIIFKHALKNALMAPITIITLHINWLIGGIVVVEVLFGFPGMGRYIVEAALFKDVFAIEAAAMVLVVVAIGSQLIADLMYVYLNPRIRYS